MASSVGPQNSNKQQRRNVGKMMFANLCLIFVISLVVQQGSTTETDFSAFKKPSGSDDGDGNRSEQADPERNGEQFDVGSLSDAADREIPPEDLQNFSDFLVKLMRSMWQGEAPPRTLESELDEMFTPTDDSNELSSNERAISPLFRRLSPTTDDVMSDVRRSRLVGLFKRSQMPLLFRRFNMPTLFKRGPLSSSLFKRSRLMSLFKRKSNDVTF